MSSQYRFSIFKLLVFVFLCALATQMYIWATSFTSNVRVQDGYSNEHYGFRVTGPYQVELFENTTLVFHLHSCSLLGMSERVPFVLVAQTDENLPLTLKTAFGINKGQPGSELYLRSGGYRVRVNHGYTGLNPEPNKYCFEEYSIHFDIPDDQSAYDKTLIFDPAKGRVFWIAFNDETESNRVVQQNLPLFPIEDVRVHLETGNDQLLVRVLKKWFSTVQKDKRDFR